MVTEEGLVDISEVATRFRVAKEPISRWINLKEFSAGPVRRLRRFPISVVDVWVKTGRGGTESVSSGKIADKVS